MALRDHLAVKSVDIRSTLCIAPSTFAELLKRAEIESEGGKGSTKDILAPDVRRILESRGYNYSNPTKVISFSICKGGVGKSTSSLYISQRLSAYGARVLAIDSDPQGNLTAAFDLESYNVSIDEETPVLIDLITGDASLEETIIKFTPNLHIIPSTPLNSTLDSKIRDKFKNPSVPIANILRPILDDYDYIVIDCSPTLNLVNTSIACASDLVILPVAPDKFSNIGLNQTLDELDTIERDFNIKIQRKIVFTKFDAREHTSLKYLGEIAKEQTHIMFKTMIRTAADVKNAITKKEYLFDYKKSNAREDYDNLTREIMGLDKFFNKKNLIQ
jgi:chromosome partitioning protein